MTITIEMNQKIRSLQIIDNIYIYIYIYMCVCVCVTTQIQMLKLLKYQKRYIIKEQVIETIQKIYDYSKEKYKKKKKVHEPIKQ